MLSPPKSSSPPVAQAAAPCGDSADLAARILTGDRRAEEELVDRFQRGVAFIIRRLVRIPEEVEDLSQETFRIALTNLRKGDLRDPERLPGYVSGLAQNLAREHLRQQARRRDHETPETGHEEPGEGANQLNRLLRREKARSVRQVIGELNNERDRQVLFRYYIAEEAKVAICRDLDLSSLHFNRVLHRARQRYRALWQERAADARAAST